MSYKLKPRLGSAIATTILSYAALSLVGVDKAQAAQLTYNFQVGGLGSNLNFFKVDNSSLTGIGMEEVAVSEGRFYGYTLEGGKEYNNLAGKSALFYEGVFRGLNASGADNVIRDIIITTDAPLEPLYLKVSRSTSWSIETYRTGFTTWSSLLSGYYEEYTTYTSGTTIRTNRSFSNNVPVSYTLVDTEPEPVPEPLTSGGTALALAGLSWLKHKKKMAT
ncbi:PEP-CTERM sorting domain-containing protein [Microcoleus sp. AR_TQ3_B6]|uniref:PEP-CTERM sorting domain-containing protein n=1 Tax=Microcoleus sp. AR_TQ3_B6 TaxID=3055284 RepID=UPI002FCFCA7C